MTPCGEGQDLERLGYMRISNPMFPLDNDMKDPNLKARLIHSSEGELYGMVLLGLLN